MAFLDENGLRYLWAKIEALMTTYVLAETGKGLSSNDFTDALLTKLNGIATGATKNIVENVLTSTSTTNALSAAQGKALKDLIDSINKSMEEKGAGDMLKSVYDTNGNGTVDNAEKVNGLTVLTAVPSDAKFTDTTYGAFTGSDTGLVPSASGKDNHYYLSADSTWHKLDVTSKQASEVEGVTVELMADNDTTLSTGYITAATTSLYGVMTPTQVSKLNNCLTESQIKELFALKTDITGVYKYKGSVAAVSNLPTTGNTTGDVYNVEARGINYAWNGSAWDALGELFEVPAIANATIDSIVAS